ncbi:hypothetical protein A0H81_11565 [Grifola frondosa]|uniref:Uncharacterized protein n=1 Tax=Grifola frondosa TaxID=5627 RepID=A0A1C7LUJ7_GRIFR|nr:hypothetical protein A0H81_11565 [Grifola frondosa]
MLLVLVMRLRCSKAESSWELNIACVVLILAEIVVPFTTATSGARFCDDTFGERSKTHRLDMYALSANVTYQCDLTETSFHFENDRYT